MELIARDRRLQFPRRPLIMGIINVNDDSFCGDGRLDPEWALARVDELTRLGADIIDVGAESARTNRPAIPAAEERRRLIPVIAGFAAGPRVRPRDDEQIFPPLLSINTWRPEVAAEALETGGHLLNDMGGLPDPANAEICARAGAALVLMHTAGAPKIPRRDVRYADVIGEVEAFFRARITMALEAGLPIEGIVLDPGIDFAKSAADNLRIYRELSEFRKLDRPILLPVSRKTVIRDVLGIEDPVERDAATAACIVAGALRGASIVRVHDVEMAWRVLRCVHRLEHC